MPSDRYYIENFSSGKEAVITGPELHHLHHVMRVQEGEEVELVNGSGLLAKAKVLTISRQQAVLEVTESFQQPPIEKKVAVIQAIPRMNRLETIVEKGTELGMTELWLFPAAASERKVLSDSQRERLKHVAISALKQSGRLYLPIIRYFPSMEAWLEEVDPFLVFGDVEPAAQPLITLLLQRLSFNEIAVAIGPESGFNREEIALMRSKGALGVSLHRHILRTDTAPLAALSIIEQVLLGQQGQL